MAFEGIPITITYKFIGDVVSGEQETEDMTLPMPNEVNGFEAAVRDEGDHIYTDINKWLRKGTAYKRAFLMLEYSSHRIQLNKLLIADKITFDLSDFDLPFSNTDFKLNTDRVKKNWFSNYVVSSSGAAQSSEYEDLNPVPSGKASLEFISIGIYNPS